MRSVLFATRDTLSWSETLLMVAPAGMLAAMSKAITARRLKPSLVRPVKMYSPAPLLVAPVALSYRVLSFEAGITTVIAPATAGASRALAARSRPNGRAPRATAATPPFRNTRFAGESMWHLIGIGP